MGWRRPCRSRLEEGYDLSVQTHVRRGLAKDKAKGNTFWQHDSSLRLIEVAVEDTKATDAQSIET